MRIVSSSPIRGRVSPSGSDEFQELIDEAYLRSVVQEISVPRHRFAEAANNAAVASRIEAQFRAHGLSTFRQGELDNIVATFGTDFDAARVLIGAHYDSVPKSPGADDNASAVAAMLGAARALAAAEPAPVAFIAFNGEEDGLAGSREFVECYLQGRRHSLEIVHVLEMVGYRDMTPGSQKSPPGLPIKISDRGDFLGIISNRYSNHLVSRLIEVASTRVPSLPVKVLKVFWGMESRFPHLLRSDHAPFWEVGVPVMMWTDTSEFRNPHYHQPSDLPDTLDYGFLEKVCSLLVAHVVDLLGLRKVPGTE